MGYANRIITIPFPELTDDPEGDPIRVTIRNPRLMAPQELIPKDAPVDAEGKPIDDEAGLRGTHEVMAKVIVGWRVYDATTEAIVDVNGNVTIEDVLLGLPATPELVAKLPLAIFERLGTELTEATNPQ
jgi:hypothetical protein